MAVDLSSLRISVTKPRGKVARRLVEMGIRVSTLPEDQDEGDVDRFIISKRLVIERRTGSGFLMGIMDKTLFTSAIYMREHFRIPVLIMEGQVNYEYRGFDPQAVRGALSSMTILYGLTVLATPDAEETAQLIAMMARQEQVGIPEISLIPKRTAASLPDRQRRVVEMLPGAGRVMARDLLQYFGSVERLVAASEQELLTLRGIGAGKAAEIRRVLTAEYEAVDTERHIEAAIEAESSLLFGKEAGHITLLDRQHHLFTEDKRKHIIDMVFLDTDADELILVELKRGRLEPAHHAQLRRYLDNARLSKLLRSHLDRGTALRGVLATVQPCELPTNRPDVTVSIIDEKRTIAVLKRLRTERLAASPPKPKPKRKRSTR